MNKNEWLSRLALSLGFNEGLPNEMQSQAHCLYEMGLPFWQAANWFHRYLKP